MPDKKSKAVPKKAVAKKTAPKKAARKKRTAGVKYRTLEVTLEKVGLVPGEIRGIVAGLKRKDAIEKLKAKRAKLQAALDRIDRKIGGVARPKAKAAAGAPARTKLAKPKKPVAQVKAKQILRVLTAKKGAALTRGEIAGALNVASAALTKALVVLVADKAIQKKGQKRGTRYFA